MKRIITAFSEHKEFSDLRPWDVNLMRFDRERVTPPHYAATVEILICFNVKGTAYIGGSRFELKAKQVFFIAPNVIHSMNYEKGDGTLYIVKIHPERLKKYLDLALILSESGRDFDGLARSVGEFDEMLRLAKILQRSDRVCFEALEAVSGMFGTVLSRSSEDPRENSRVSSKDAALRRIISWTEERFAGKISLDDVSRAFGYSKNYFCAKFKAETGKTYFQYLNGLRIIRACELLKTGLSVSEVCEKSGFEDASYFIRLFKKTVGVTPKVYIKNLNLNK